MRIALYNENLGELKALAGQLDQCAREYLCFAEIVPYARQENFCSMVRDGPDFDLFVVVQDGTSVWRWWNCCGRNGQRRGFSGFLTWISPCAPTATTRTGSGESLLLCPPCRKPLGGLWRKTQTLCEQSVPKQKSIYPRCRIHQSK